ncbi:hypothetical protein ACMFMG_008299 [Clarireedia jacksonii]
MSTEINTVTCHCLQCKSVLGTYENSWEGIGKTYIIPSVVINAIGLKGTGPIKQANTPVQIGTPVENSFLQDAACTKCDAKLGLRCDGAPVGHLLKKDQYLLCSKLMSITSDATGEKATLIITKTHALKNSSNASKVTLQRTSMLAKTPRSSKFTSQLTPAHHTPTAASPAVSTDSTVFAAICEQRKDIDRIDAAVNRLESDMLEFMSFMKEMRQKLDEGEPSRSSRDSPILELRAELSLVQSRMKDLEDSTQRTLGEINRSPAPSGPSDGQPKQQQVIGGKDSGAMSRKRSQDQLTQNQANEAKDGTELLSRQTPLPSRQKGQYYQRSSTEAFDLGGESPEPLSKRRRVTIHSEAAPQIVADTQETISEILPSHSQSPDLAASFSTNYREPSPILGNDEPTVDTTSSRGEKTTNHPSPDPEEILQREIEDSFQEASQPSSLPIPQPFFAHEVPSSTRPSQEEPTLPSHTHTPRRIGRPRGAKSNPLTSTVRSSLTSDDPSIASIGRSLRRRGSTLHAGAPRTVGSAGLVDKDGNGNRNGKENWTSDFAVEIEVEVNRTIPMTTDDNESGKRRSKSRRNTGGLRQASVDLDEVIK